MEEGENTAEVVGPRDRLPFLAFWHTLGRETENRRRKSGSSSERTPRALGGPKTVLLLCDLAYKARLV